MKLDSKNVALMLLLVVGLFAGIRFIHLQADFAGTRESGVGLTDEGWYTRAATEQVLHGAWYVPGDLNAAVSVPMLPLVDYVAFRLLGVSLLTARLVNVFFVFLCLLFSYLWVREYEGSVTALSVAALLALSSFWFTYSRIALLEFPMTAFILVSLYFASRRGHDLFFGFVTGLALLCATLTKWTALAAAPAVYLTIWLRYSPPGRIRRYITCSAMLLAGLGFFKLYFLTQFRSDAEFFVNLNVTQRIHSGPLWASFARAVYHARWIDPVLYCAAIGVLFSLAFHFREIARKPLMAISATWVLMHLAALTYAHYHPARYYVSMAVPIVILVVLEMKRSWQRRTAVAYLFAAAIAVSICYNVAGITETLFQTRYSYIGMQKDVARIMRNEAPGTVLLGHFANSVTLGAGVRSINDYGTMPIEQRLAMYNPGFFLAQDAPAGDSAVMKTLKTSYDCRELAQYQLLNEPALAHLYRLTPRKQF